MVTILPKLYFGPIPHNLTKPFWQEIWFLPFIIALRERETFCIHFACKKFSVGKYLCLKKELPKCLGFVQIRQAWFIGQASLLLRRAALLPNPPLNCITYQRLLLILGLVFHSNSKAWQWPWLLLSWASPHLC